MTRASLYGVGLWVVGTLGIRLAGQLVLHPNQTAGTLVLYAVSFLLMAVVVRRICTGMRLEKDSWFAAVTLLILPTLLLDPLSCAFFPQIFPNVDPAAAGVFGGWMLICCAGAVAGVWWRR